MSVSPYIDQEERESQVLRASVVEAAMTLGPKVTGWMFENAVTEEDEEEEEERMLTPGLVSSPSSDDSHSVGFSSQDGHGGSSQHPLISLPSKLTPKMEQGYYLKSPFVVIDEGQFPRYMETPGYPYVPPINTDIQRRPGLVSSSSTSSVSAQSASSKKSGKGFIFSKKSPSSQMLSSQNSQNPLSGSASTSSQPSHTTFSAPRKTSLDDPIPRASTPSSSGRASPSSRSPGKLKKQRLPERKGKDVEPPLPVQGPQGPQGWDFKDPDRPSFFATENNGPAMPRSSSALGQVDAPKGKKKAKKVSVDDGYMSEGTGKSKVRNKEDKDKDKDKRPGAKRSMTSRLMSKWSTSDLHAEKAKVLAPPVPPLPVPIHDKFASKGLTVSVTAERESETDLVRDETTQLSAEWQARSPYLNVPRSGGTAEPSPSSSTSSFALVPDLNVVARHKINVSSSSKGSNGHAIGSDNDAKLAMLAKLISEPVAPVPVIAVQPPAQTVASPSSKGASENVELLQEVEVPSTSFIVPSPTSERRPPSTVLRYYDVPLSPKPPTPSHRTPPPAAFGNRARPHAHGHTSAQLRADTALAASYESMRAGSAPPSVMTHQIQVRGRQAPFPTRPILPSAARQGTGLARSASQSRLSTNPVLVNNPRFHATPQRYRNVQNLPVPDADVPRSVRSSFEKDQEREERLDMPSDERDDRSVYSVSTRASIMDVGKSVDTREKFVKGVDALIEAGQAARGPRWF